MSWKALTLAGLILGATAQTAQADSVKALVADYNAFILSEDPVLAGQQGDKTALRRWPDNTPATIAAAKNLLEKFRDRAAKLPATTLPEPEKLDLSLLARAVATRLEAALFDAERIPFFADDGFYNLPDYVARGTVLHDDADADAWVARLEAIPAYYAAEIANARRGLAQGFVQAKIAVEASLNAARAQAAAAPETSAFLTPFKDRPQFKARALEIVTTKIKPAQRDLVTFLERDYLPKARAQAGISSVPQGRPYYEFLVRRYTTTKLTPDAVHDLGKAEVARIHAEMDKVMGQANFKGTFAEFLAFLRHDPQFYVTSRQALLEKASEIAKRIDDQLPHQFATLPRLTYGVRSVPAEIEENYTTGRYWTGSPEQGLAGGYMVNTSHLDQRPLYELPALTLHEAVPGHHLQIALAQENKNIALFRRHSDMTVFVEGWALYSEKLGIDMGIYRTPYEDFGRLSFEMWRACRLVIDTGLHWKGWSREEARRYLAENTALSDKNIDVEIDRYIGWPGQALAYKIGEMKIVELRDHARSTLGAKFDPRAFHDAVLENGPLPLDVLSERINTWIAARR